MSADDGSCRVSIWSKCDRSGGYALLMTVLLLAIAAVALSMLGRHSFRQAMTALRAEEELQRRWAILSCEQVLLPQAAGLVDFQPNEATAALAATAPSPIERRTLRLGRTPGVDTEDTGLRIDLIFGDEQAKLNVPALLARTDRPTAEGVIGTLLHGRGLTPSVRLEPFESEPESDAEDAGGYRWPLIASFDQVLVDARPDVLVGSLPDSARANPEWRSRRSRASLGSVGGIAEGLTLWGDGRVNIRTVPEDVLRAAVAPDLGFAQVFRIVELRREQPEAGLSDILNQLELSDQQRDRMEQRLTDGSEAHSLWIVVSNGNRSWHHLTIQTAAPGSTPGNVSGDAPAGSLKRVERLIW